MAKHAVGVMNGNWRSGLYLTKTRASVQAEIKQPCLLCGGEVEPSPMASDVCYGCYREALDILEWLKNDPDWEVRADALHDAVYLCLSADQAQAHLDEKRTKNSQRKPAVLTGIDPRTADQVAFDKFADEVQATRASDYPV